MAKKGDLIKEIFKIVGGGDNTTNVDRLSDKTIDYLAKYLRVVKTLK